MTIHGTALLSLCLLAGLTAGRLLGASLGIDADIGGVGIAMLLLIGGCQLLERHGLLPPPVGHGVTYWGQMYVPIVVAMAASQNVRGAVAGGWMAVAAGLVATAAAFVLVGVLVRWASGPEPS
ncbi:MAG: malonate transporter subunit MadL [Planctomycetaceae bacterium]